jgi:hypothetical protein
MRAQHTSLPRHLLAISALCLALPALAQNAPGKVTPAEPVPLAAGEAKVMERITHEDAGSRIDELRVGGRTRSIDVQPKNGAPAYEIAPQPTVDTANDGKGSSGRSRWRILSF